MGQLFKNVASQKLRVFAFADAGHATLDAGEPVTGDAANISARTAVDNAALGASNDAAPTEVDATNAPGYYEFDPTQGETNGDVIEWYPKSSTAGVQVVTVGGNIQTTQPQYLPDLNIASDGDFAGNVDGAVASVTGAVGSVTGAVGSVTGNVGGNVTGSVGSVLGGINTTAGTITTLDGLDTAQDTQHSTTQGLVTTVDNVADGIKAVTDLLPDSGALTSIATASALSTVGTNVSTLVTKLTTGITSLAEWLGLLAGKQTGDATALTEIRATGAGSGTFDPTTDSAEAIRDTEPLGTAMRGTDSAATASALATAQADLDTITGSDGVTLATTQGNYAPAVAGDAMALTSGERDAVAAALLDLAAGVETNRTLRQAMRLILAACAGKLSGAATSTNTFRDTNDTVDRIIATVDADGNRSAVTLDAS